MSHCKPGDLAMITHDVPSCSANIGRIVVVGGPPAVNRRRQLTWLIRPVANEPYMVNGCDGKFLRFMGFEERHIEHPDRWMVPIHPDELQAAAASSTDILATGRDAARALPPAPQESETETRKSEEIRP